MSTNFHYTVIGGGLVGLGTARAIVSRFPGAHVQILEKEAGPGRHQSTHNSGVLHAGLYYKPGSLKAKLAVSGIRMMTAFCTEKEIPCEICGKIVLATDESEVPRLRELERRGTANGLTGLRWLNADELREIEPHASGVAALHVPEEGIVDYEKVCSALVREFETNGGVFTPSAPVQGIEQTPDGWVLRAGDREFRTRYVVNCAGLFCDRVAELAGVRRDIRIVPFRGEYFRLGSGAPHLVKNMIYPVPDPTFPFLGVHSTRLIHGGIEARPTAVLAVAREAYTKWDFSLPDRVDALSFSGLRKFLGRHP